MNRFEKVDPGPSWLTMSVVTVAYICLAFLIWSAGTLPCGQGFLHGPSGSCSGSPAVAWPVFTLPAVGIGAIAAGLIEKWWPLLAGMAFTLVPAVFLWPVLVLWDRIGG